YYAGPGAQDPLVIELPRGSYVPIFRRRVATTVSTPESWPPLPFLPAWLRRRLDAPVSMRTCLRIVAFAALFIAAIPWWRGHGEGPDAARRLAAPRATQTVRLGNGMPTLALQPLDVTGTPGPGAISPTALVEKMGDAFARFDAINIISQP